MQETSDRIHQREGLRLQHKRESRRMKTPKGAYNTNVTRIGHKRGSDETARCFHPSLQTESAVTIFESWQLVKCKNSISCRAPGPAYVRDTV
ncbi:hypothetical protein EVAR_64152_1 [Eumeta japonica]|uniref:Uncharacterized protein n=1 Tax=Eumeta variegata TaxID=151549 RepID=A0A4C1ZYP6_EUMVA|nr:hypothetical protein EVAR_64152_1 [Eumeta japonica]